MNGGTSLPPSSRSTRERAPEGTREQPGNRGPNPPLKKTAPSRVDGLRAGAGEEHRIEAVRQACGQLLGEHPGQRRVVDLHARWEVCSQRRLEHVADVEVVVAEAREALARVEVEIGAAVFVV